jgi:hypothetical protein
LPELRDLKFFSSRAFADEARAAAVRTSRRLFDGVWNAGGDGEWCGHADVMSDVWQFNMFTCINTFTCGAGTSRILEDLMARRGLVEPGEGVGCWVSGFSAIRT